MGAYEDLWRLTRTGTRTGINEDWGNPDGDHANQANGETIAGADQASEAPDVGDHAN
jgi:hypothetical protein